MSINEEEEILGKRPPDEKGLGEIRKGSVLNGIINLTKSILGVGLLGSPYSFYRSGIILGVLIEFFAFFCALIGGLVISHFAIQGKGVRSTQSLMGENCGKILKIFAQILGILLPCGACITYFVSMGQIALPLFQMIFGEESFLSSKTFILLVGGCLVVFPLVLIREIKKFGFLSFLSNLITLYLVVSVLITTLIKIIKGTLHTQDFMTVLLINDGFVKGTKFPLLLMVFPLKIYQYTIQNVLTPICYELKHPTNFKKTSTVIISSLLIALIVYNVFGISFFLCYGNLTNDNIFLTWTDNILGIIGRYLFLVNVFNSIPVTIFICRLNITTILTGKDIKLSTFPYIIISLLIFSCCIILALLIPNITSIYSLTSAICSSTFFFFFPSFLIIKLGLLSQQTNPKKKFLLRVICFSTATLMLFLWILFSTTGTVASSLRFFE